MSLYGLDSPSPPYPYGVIFRYCLYFSIFWNIWYTFSFDTIFIDMLYIEFEKMNAEAESLIENHSQ